MTQRVLIGLLAVTVLVLAAMAIYLATTGSENQPTSAKVSTGSDTGAGDGRQTVVAGPGQTVPREQVPNRPPTPKPVNNEERIRQNLVPGKTYATHTKGVIDVRGTDTDWGVTGVGTINYAFEAFIDREIESNDGKVIVEVRHFRDVRSLKVDCQLENLRLDLGPIGELLLPDSVRHFTENTSLKPALSALRWAGYDPNKIMGYDQTAAMFGKVDRLSGKSVRIRYEDGKGVLDLQPVKGEMTAAERDFHMASVLLSDSLVFPDMEVKIGTRWTVDGPNFSNLVDPGLLARTSGEVTLERAKDKIAGVETCRCLEVVSGRLRLDDSNPSVGQVGYFDPRGEMLFSPSNQVIIQAHLKGAGKLERFSRDHLLFPARMRRQPDIEVKYSCKIVDTVKLKRP